MTALEQITQMCATAPDEPCGIAMNYLGERDLWQALKGFGDKDGTHLQSLSIYGLPYVVDPDLEQNYLVFYDRQLWHNYKQAVENKAIKRWQSRGIGAHPET